MRKKNNNQRAKRRATDLAKAKRKQRILKESAYDASVTEHKRYALGRLNKGKIHCSCPMCKEAKKTRKPRIDTYGRYRWES